MSELLINKGVKTKDNKPNKPKKNNFFFDILPNILLDYLHMSVTSLIYNIPHHIY